MSHAKLPPSASSGWAYCPAAAAAYIARDREETEHTTRGSVFHGVMERTLRRYWGEGCSTEVAKAYCRELSSELPDEFRGEAERFLPGLFEQTAGLLGESDKVFFEERLCMKTIDPGGGLFGTADVVYIKGSVLGIVDDKFGRVPVFAENNTQIALYGIGALEKLEKRGLRFETFMFHILSPFSSGGGTWCLSRKELLAWRDFLRNAYAVAKAELSVAAKSRHYCPGWKQCAFCPARESGCAAFDRFAAVAVSCGGGNPVAERFKNAQGLDNHELVNVLKNSTNIKKWLNELSARAYSILEKGGELPGAHLVAGRTPPAAWAGDEFDSARAVGRKLGVSPVEFNVVSPARMRDMRGNAKAFEAAANGRIVRAKAPKTLAFDGDTREKATSSIAAMVVRRKRNDG